MNGRPSGTVIPFPGRSKVVAVPHSVAVLIPYNVSIRRLMEGLRAAGITLKHDPHSGGFLMAENVYPSVHKDGADISD